MTMRRKEESESNRFVDVTFFLYAKKKAKTIWDVQCQSVEAFGGIGAIEVVHSITLSLADDKALLSDITSIANIVADK